MANPVVKWAGGKRQLLPIIKSKLPKEFNTYYEPFLGGGALLFDLSPERAIINDFNSQLINVYEVIKDNRSGLIEALNELQEAYNGIPESIKSDFYLEKRNAFNQYIQQNRLSLESAALFIFLNKTGFNGLYRVNSSGMFNVPSAHKKQIKLYDNDNLFEVSRILNRCEIFNMDFEKVLIGAKENDFVFFDSPYYDTFDTYQAGGFTIDDHKRLADVFNTLTNKGVKCMLTNNDCIFIKELYKDYNVEVIDVKRMINCKGNARTGKEVIITNY